MRIAVADACLSLSFRREEGLAVSFYVIFYVQKFKFMYVFDHFLDSKIVVSKMLVFC